MNFSLKNHRKQIKTLPMKKLLFSLGAIVLLVLFTNFTFTSLLKEDATKTSLQTRQFYQLKTYTLANEEQVQMTDSYLREAFLPALKKLNIGPVGVFKPIPVATDTLHKILVLVPFASLTQMQVLEDALQQDETYLNAGKAYIHAAHDQPAYQRMGSVILQAFKNMPVLKAPMFETPRNQRVYELRSYESPSENYYKNKVEMFNEGGEVQLFDRLQFNAVFYGEVISGPKMPNLMYLTTFSDQESRDAHWKAFGDSPEWKTMSSLPKYQNNVSHADITFLYPTDYSEY